MKGRKYSEYELKFLIENFREMSNHDIAEKINKKPSSINAVLYKLGLYRTKEEKKLVRRQNKKELCKDSVVYYIVENINELSNRELALNLGISPIYKIQRIIKFYNLRRSEFGMKKMKQKGQKIAVQNRLSKKIISC